MKNIFSVPPRLPEFSLTMEMQVLRTSYNQSFFLELKV